MTLLCGGSLPPEVCKMFIHIAVEFLEFPMIMSRTTRFKKTQGFIQMNRGFKASVSKWNNYMKCI